MAEARSSSWCKTMKAMDSDSLITELEVDAAQQLMELSDEDKNSNNIRDSKRRRRWEEEEEEEVDQRPSDIVMAKIQEIFGKDIEVFPPKKQRRYRSLVNIYMTTRPIDAGNNTRVKA